MKLTRRTILAAACSAAMLAQPMMAAAQDLPRNVRLVIGSGSTGGDTYQAASLVAEALSEHFTVVGYTHGQEDANTICAARKSGKQ